MFKFDNSLNLYQVSKASALAQLQPLLFSL